jgi:hypothetical protein
MDWHYLVPEDETYIDELVGRRTRMFAAELYEKARLDDSESMEVLVSLVTPDPDDHPEDSLFQERTGEAYAFPPDWNKLIVRLFENPSLEVFVGCEREPDPGVVRRRAARALLPDLSWEERLVNAQIVLAYANRRDDNDQYVWKDEVGEILLAEVSKLVATIHNDQQLAIIPAVQRSAISPVVEIK